jgi:hypothetical protein
MSRYSLTARLLDILLLLADKPRTQTELARIFKVSTRTIRDDMTVLISHAHILAVRRVYYEQSELVEDWLTATGGAAFVVDIREIVDVQKSVAECLKYAFKPKDLEQWSAAMVKEFLDMKGARFSSLFGCLYGMEIEPEESQDEADEPQEGSACPECGEPLFSVVLTPEEIAGLEAGAWIQNKHGTVH